MYTCWLARLTVYNYGLQNHTFGTVIKESVKDILLQLYAKTFSFYNTLIKFVYHHNTTHYTLVNTQLNVNDSHISYIIRIIIHDQFISYIIGWILL